PPWLDGKFHPALKPGPSHADDVLVIRVVIDADVSRELDVTPARDAANTHPSHGHDYGAEHSRCRRILVRRRKGNLVIAFALSAMGSVETQRGSRDQGEINARFHFVVIIEPSAQADAENLILLRRILVVVGEI